MQRKAGKKDTKIFDHIKLFFQTLKNPQTHSKHNQNKLTVGMVHWIHGNSSHMRSPAHVAATTSHTLKKGRERNGQVSKKITMKRHENTNTNCASYLICNFLLSIRYWFTSRMLNQPNITQYHANKSPKKHRNHNKTIKIKPTHLTRPGCAVCWTPLRSWRRNPCPPGNDE